MQQQEPQQEPPPGPAASLVKPGDKPPALKIWTWETGAEPVPAGILTAGWSVSTGIWTQQLAAAQRVRWPALPRPPNSPAWGVCSGPARVRLLSDMWALSRAPRELYLRALPNSMLMDDSHQAPALRCWTRQRPGQPSPALLGLTVQRGNSDTAGEPRKAPRRRPRGLSPGPIPGNTAVSSHCDQSRESCVGKPVSGQGVRVQA